MSRPGTVLVLARPQQGCQTYLSWRKDSLKSSFEIVEGK